MDFALVTYFLLFVLLGTYVQSVAGFAMGMIITATVGGMRLLPLPELTAVVSLLSLLNVVLALRGDWRLIQTQLFIGITLGMLPAIALGLWLLLWLDTQAQAVLYLALGLFVALGSLSMTLKPVTQARVSSRTAAIAAGFCGGLVGGMFSASGPVMGWFNYRQPLPLAVVRATLLSCFAITTSVRTVLVGSFGGLTAEVWLYTALALPVVVVGTWAGRHWPPRLAEATMKRAAFGLLLVMGIGITATAWVALLG